MPNGKVHIRLWKQWSFLAIIPALLALYAQDFLTALCIPLGYLMGAFIGPDLDQVGISSDEGRMMRSFGFLGSLFAAWWLPYAYLMRFLGGHRSFWSHLPLISTALRFAWGFWPIVGLGTWWIITRNEFWVLPIAGRSIIGLISGMTVSDTVHCTADLLAPKGRTTWKRYPASIGKQTLKHPPSKDGRKYGRRDTRGR